jgi:hypothetical protein
MTLQVCHICRRVSENKQEWVTKQVYQKRTGSQVPFRAVWRHEYCPDCLKYLSSYRQAA